MFSDPIMDYNCKATIDVSTINGVRVFGSYTQLSWTVHFLQILLPQSVAILKMLPIGTFQILMDMMFMQACNGNGLPICN